MLLRKKCVWGDLMFRIVTMCYGSETPPSPPPPSPNLFGHTVQFFSVIPSPYACRGRTVLQFPTNSYHLFTVELALKAVLALASAVNVLWYASNPPLIDPTAMPGGWAPIRANQLSMVVRMHKVVRMRKVLAITQWWYVCFSTVNWYC